MKMFKASIFSVIFVFMSSASGYCGFIDGNSLLRSCTTEKQDETYYQQNASCLYYTLAIADSSKCGTAVNGYSWQPQKNVIASQLTKVVTKWLLQHPEELHYSANGLVGAALQNAFPCK